MAEVFLHNWLYSVVPVGIEQINHDHREYPSGQGGTLSIYAADRQYPLAAYLTGYCRNCGKAFSEPIPHGYSYVESQMNVNKFGCIGPERDV